MPRAGRSVVRRLSDAQLATLATQAESLKAKGKKLAGYADKRYKKIIGELERRGTTGILHDGVKVTKVVNEQVVYDWDYLEQECDSRQWRAITKRVGDVALLGRAVQEGIIPLEMVEAATRVRPSSPYVRVSIK